MNPIYYDTETTSLAGMPVLIQFAYGEGEIILYEIWKHKISETLDLIESFMNYEEGLVGFNLSFDHFMLTKLWNTFNLYHNHNEIPENIIDELAVLEEKARDGKALKPRACCDLMLVARRGPYQSLMERKPIKIKKVPTLLAYPLAQYLERKIKLKEIYFAKRKNKYEPKWKVEDYEYADGEKDSEFKNIVLRFNASSALKALAIDALNIKSDDILLYGDISVDSRYVPSKKKGEEFEFAPFALAVGKPGDWRGAWPEIIKHHIKHWNKDQEARKYAADDVIYTRGLYEFFGRPPMNDDDSVLACLIGTSRWKGYAVDLEAIKKLKREAEELAESAPTAPEQVRKYIYSQLSEVERVVLLEMNKNKFEETTKKIVIQEIAGYTEKCYCTQSQDEQGNPIDVNPFRDCPECEGKGVKRTEAAKLAKKVFDARLAGYEINFYEKILRAGRLHADFFAIGALSGRMSGAGGLNTQGIKKEKKVRSCFTLAFPGEQLAGGDFESFEVVLADAKYADPDLRKALQTVITCPFCNGKNSEKCNECNGTGKHPQTIHGLFGTFMYPGMSYVDVLRTKGTADDKYKLAKSGVFLNLYAGTEHAMKERLGIDIDLAKDANERFFNRFKGLKNGRQQIADMFQAMKQEGGIGTKVIWNEPAEYIETMFGFRRYFTLENQICRALFEVAENPPAEWLKLKIKVTRQDREQTVGGAVRSSLFAASFNIQGQNTRSGINHVIQGSGAYLTKKLEVEIWNLQPAGIHDWVVRPMNIHDEVNTPTKPEYIPQLETIVHNFIEEHKKVVPLLSISWNSHMMNWSD